MLNGSDDRLFARRLSDLITGRDPSGGNVVLTIDPAVQQAAYERLTSRDYAGAVVALRPQTGRDPGDGLHARRTTRTSWPATAPKTQTAAWEQFNDAEPPVLTNRAISETYPPGSTFKLIDTAAALQSGGSPRTASSRPRRRSRCRTPRRNWRTSPARLRHRRDGLACATRWPARATPPSRELAAQLGEDKIRAQAEAFGVGTAPPAIPMTVAPSTLGDIPDTAVAAAVRDRAARRPVHPAAERDDRGRDRQRRPGDGALPGPADPQPDAGRARRDPAGPARPGDARRRRGAR